MHQYPISLYLKTYTPACKDPILCTVFSGQALNFSRQSLLPKIGPELPRRTLTLDNEEYMQEPGKLKFLHRGKIFDANNVQLPALAVSLTRKDIRRLSNMSRWTSKQTTVYDLHSYSTLSWVRMETFSLSQFQIGQHKDFGISKCL